MRDAASMRSAIGSTPVPTSMKHRGSSVCSKVSMVIRASRATTPSYMLSGCGASAGKSFWCSRMTRSG